MNLRKDHYRTSLTVVKHCVRELVFAVRVCTEKWDSSRRRRSPRGRSRIPNFARFIASLGYLRHPPLGREARARISSLRRFKERVSPPPHDAHNQFHSLVNQLESPNLEGGSGDAPHSDGRRALAVAATRRPVKQKYNS